MTALKADTDMKDENAPEDIRKAVQQLSFAYRRSQTVISEAAPGDPISKDDEPGTGTIAETFGNDAEDFTGVSGVSDIAADAVRRAEAVLFAAGEPLSAEQVASALPMGVDAATVLMDLKRTYAGRGVRLVEVAGKWRFQTADDLAFLFVEERQEQKKLTQAQLETLSIIAYGQPVTRAEIEAVRGVAVSKGTLDVLMEAGWIRLKGRRKTPGRPVTYGTTDAFLEHFGLESLDVLPGKAELEAEGLLSDVIPEGFSQEGEQPGPPSEAIDDIVADIAQDLEEGDFVTDFMGADETPA